jgi:hypothetical protein
MKTKRNETKRNQRNENEIKRNQRKQKRNQRKQDEIEKGRKNNRGLKEIKPDTLLNFARTGIFISEL